MFPPAGMHTGAASSSALIEAVNRPQFRTAREKLVPEPSSAVPDAAALRTGQTGHDAAIGQFSRREDVVRARAEVSRAGLSSALGNHRA